MTQHNIEKLRRLLQITARTVNAMGTITEVWTREPVAAFTFDGGPDPEWTPRFLDVLEKRGTRATFFMIGKCAQEHPGLVRQVAQAGHAIGNHSWDHPSFPLISSRERRWQIRACAEVLAPYGQRLFRPPYGHQSVASRLDLLLLGYQVVTWNVHAFDWTDQDAGWMADRLASQIRPGCIILLHEAVCVERHLSRWPELEALDMLLEKVGRRFRFIALPELFRYGPPQKRNWYNKPNLDLLNRLRTQATEGFRRDYGACTALPPEAPSASRGEQYPRDGAFQHFKN